MSKKLQPDSQIFSGQEIYEQGWREGRLLLQVCGDCGQVRCPPAQLCPDCGSPLYSWRAASGRARLWSWNRFHKTYFPDFPAPYLTVFAQLEEGPILISSLEKSDSDDLQPDQPLELYFSQGLPIFRAGIF